MIRHFRYTHIGTMRNIRFALLGRPVRMYRDPSYDGAGLRSVAGIGIETMAGHFSIMWQHCREGYELASHRDGIQSNRAIWIEIKRAKIGGDLAVDGPCKRFLFGRVRLFDGGKYEHRVTKIAQGSRIVLMLQHGRYEGRMVKEIK